MGEAQAKKASLADQQVKKSDLLFSRRIARGRIVLLSVRRLVCRSQRMMITILISYFSRGLLVTSSNF